MSKQQASVSVVIPVYNEIERITACLEALAAQTEPPLEIVIVDNNSRDGTIEIARKYSGVRIVRESRQGIIFARRTGFESARGDVIASIDADTTVAPGWVACVQRQFTDDSELVGLGGSAGFSELSPRGWHVGRSLYGLMFRGSIFLNNRVWPTKILLGHNFAIRRSVWNDLKQELYVGPDGVSVTEDMELTALLLRRGFKVAYDRRMLVNIGLWRSTGIKKSLKYRRLAQRAFKKHR